MKYVIVLHGKYFDSYLNYNYDIDLIDGIHLCFTPYRVVEHDPHGGSTIIFNSYKSADEFRSMIVMFDYNSRYEDLEIVSYEPC